eukprot:TRINITY_DN92244_c0_g1_i1.p1 TRINITY_DN92244_c0_g1~~TRINITY_DN92244_c0_g1_i1.p1  ORF type:complete len:444 (-),score=109.79 TRINITY_DN92244_c0_g1_i1:28-1359(-)
MPAFLDLWQQQQGQLALPLFLRHATAFTEQGVEEGICDEGYRCVSSISHFGRGHLGKVAETEDRAAEDADAEDKGPIPKYEWNCPHGENWHDMRWSKEPCQGGRNGDAWCLCVERGSAEESHERKQGVETVFGRFKAYDPTADNTTAKVKEMAIVQHYPFRDFGSLDVHSTYAGLGRKQWHDRDEWFARYKDWAAKVQDGLDVLRAEIDKDYTDKGSLLGLTGAPKAAQKQETGDLAKMQGSDVLQQADNALSLHRIRKFQFLAKDCEEIRDTAEKLADKPDSTKFAVLGVSPTTHRKLLCFHKKSDDNQAETACSRLNCYRGPEDVLFLQRLRQLKQKLVQKETEAAAAAAVAAEANAPGEQERVPAAGLGDETLAGADGAGPQGGPEELDGSTGADASIGQPSAGQDLGPPAPACLVGFAPATGHCARRAKRVWRQGRSFL